MSVLSGAVSLTDPLCHLKTVSNRNICGLGKFLCHQTCISTTEVLHRLLSDRHHLILFSGYLLFHELEQIGVVASCETAVTRDHDVTPFFAFALSGVRRHEICISRCNLSKGIPKHLKTGLADLGTFLCFAQLGGCHQFHRFGNLHGALYALHTQLYRFHICSHEFPPLFSFIQLPFTLFCF